MAKIEIDPKQAKELYQSLNCRIAVIETGHAHLRAVDAKNCGWNSLIKKLSPEQMQLVAELEDLQKIFLKIL